MGILTHPPGVVCNITRKINLLHSRYITKGGRAVGTASFFRKCIIFIMPLLSYHFLSVMDIDTLLCRFLYAHTVEVVPCTVVCICICCDIADA